MVNFVGEIVFRHAFLRREIFKILSAGSTRRRGGCRRLRENRCEREKYNMIPKKKFIKITKFNGLSPR